MFVQPHFQHLQLAFLIIIAVDAIQSCLLETKRKSKKLPLLVDVLYLLKDSEQIINICTSRKNYQIERPKHNRIYQLIAYLLSACEYGLCNIRLT